MCISLAINRLVPIKPFSVSNCCIFAPMSDMVYFTMSSMISQCVQRHDFAGFPGAYIFRV